MENETKKCKKCQSDIPKKAKVCPHCRSKQNIGVGKIILIVLVVLLLIGIFGGDSEEEVIKNESNVSDIETVEDVVEEDFESKITVSAEYVYENTIGDTIYLIVVKNNSNETVKVNVNSTAKDADGNMIGANSASEDAIGAGEESCIICYFSGVEDAESFENTISIVKDLVYESALPDLSIEENRTDTKVVLSVTNNGDSPAEFVYANAVFFKYGEVVYYGSTYIVDADHEIKPGATVASEIDCYKGYDDVKVFISGKK